MKNLNTWMRQEILKVKKYHNFNGLICVCFKTDELQYIEYLTTNVKLDVSD